MKKLFIAPALLVSLSFMGVSYAEELAPVPEFTSTEKTADTKAVAKWQFLKGRWIERKGTMAERMARWEEKWENRFSTSKDNMKEKNPWLLNDSSEKKSWEDLYGANYGQMKTPAIKKQTKKYQKRLILDENWKAIEKTMSDHQWEVQERN